MEKWIEVSDPTVIEELCGTDIKKVMFGDRFMVALTESQEMYTGGLCLYGRCGNGMDSETYCKPNKILIEGQLIIDISCSHFYTVLLTDKQQVYTFGSSDISGRDPDLTPTRIGLFGFEKITSISSGYYHGLALTQTGKLYAWGCNEYGQLGLKDSKRENKPKLVEMPNNVSVKQISCGNEFNLLLTKEGNIYSFGRNYYGELGHNNNAFCVKIPTLIVTKSKFTEILAFGSQSFALNESNGIEFWGQMTDEIISSPHKTNVSSLQEAIILCNKYPFTIEPIIITEEMLKKLTETNEILPSIRVMKSMLKGFNNHKNSDFRFKIECQEYDFPKDSSNDGIHYKFIYCYKWFVEENCNFLKEMFANRKSVNETEIKGYSYETYYHFIQYLYTDSIETKDIQVLMEMLLLSDMYSEEELKTRSVSVIKPLINVENVCNIYSSAIENRSTDLEEYCFEFMTKNIKSIIKTKSYSELDPKIAKNFYTKKVEKLM